MTFSASHQEAHLRAVAAQRKEPDRLRGELAECQRLLWQALQTPHANPSVWLGGVFRLIRGVADLTIEVRRLPPE